MRPNRNNNDASGAVAKLPDIKTGIEVGGYVGYRFGGDEHGRGEIGFDLTVLKDVNGAHDGIVAIGQVSYAAVRRSRFFLDIDAQTTFGNRKYMQTYFGITPQQSAVSGLAQYRPGAGLRDVGTGITAGYQFNSRWGLISRIGGSYYVGDVKDSPIVRAGSKVQIVGGLGVAFRF
jgi:outer membrane scaffolding protein for murein synthesis (MipA/OmpV family)